MSLPVERPTFIQTFLWRVLNWYKTIKLCELSTGYLWSFLVYTGVKTELWSSLTDPSKNKTPAMALNITEPLLHSGHTLQMANYFNSPDLAQFLKTKVPILLVPCMWTEKSTFSCHIKKTQERRSCWATTDVAVLAWQDKKAVTFISTYQNGRWIPFQKMGKK
jgi:hypothetical protein